MNDRLEQIEARAKDLTDLCPDHLRQGIRHLQRNCDMECPVHDEEAKWYDCNQPDRYDGGRMAEALSDIPTLLALVREQQARLDKVARIAASMDRIADFHFEVLGQVDSMGISLRQHAEDIRAALTASQPERES